jgi:hypothetical protein
MLFYGPQTTASSVDESFVEQFVNKEELEEHLTLETRIVYFKCCVLGALYVYSVYLKDWRESENNFEVGTDRAALSKMIDRMMFDQLATDARRREEARYKEKLIKKGKIEEVNEDQEGEETSSEEEEGEPIPEKINMQFKKATPPEEQRDQGPYFRGHPKNKSNGSGKDKQKADDYGD